MEILIYILGTIALIDLIFSAIFYKLGKNTQSPAFQHRVNRLEQKVDLILQNLGIEYQEPPSKLSDRVRELAKAGEKIQAIKVYREETGAGLAEAKDAVEEWMSANGV